MLTIRKALPTDYESLTQLLFEFDKDTKEFVSEKLLPYETYADPKLTIQETVKTYINDSQYLIFIAEEDGKSLGYICGEIQVKKYRMVQYVGYIIGWFVKKEKRKNNIGKKLFDEMVKKFKEHGCTYIHLDTFSGNKPAINIYHKLGFEDRLLGLVKQI